MDTDSEYDIPLSKLVQKQAKTKTSSDSSFSSEDDILLSDIGKPRMRSRTRKLPVPAPDDRFPHCSKSSVNYAESDIRETCSDESASKKKRKINPLLLPGPSLSRIQSQGYITRSKKKDDLNSKDTSVKSAVTLPTPESPQDNNDESGTTLNGSFKVTTHGVVKPKRLRNFKCKICDVVATSRKELNNHHKSTHDKVSCPHCNQVFNTPSSLARHAYSHQANLKHKCEQCGKAFAFESQLESHKVIHKKLATLRCNKSLSRGKVCGKWFKRAGELKGARVIWDKVISCEKYFFHTLSGQYLID